jgi:hypothetical protein
MTAPNKLLTLKIFTSILWTLFHFNNFRFLSENVTFLYMITKIKLGTVPTMGTQTSCSEDFNEHKTVSSCVRACVCVQARARVCQVHSTWNTSSYLRIYSIGVNTSKDFNKILTFVPS